MSTSTPNYGLVKPTLLENADVGVINSNMDTIDTQLKAVSDALAGSTITRTVGAQASTRFNNALANDAKLQFSVLGPATNPHFYVLHAVLYFVMPTSGTSGGFKVDITFPGSTTRVMYITDQEGTVGASGAVVAGKYTSSHAAVAALNKVVCVTIDARFLPNADGLFAIQWAQATTSADGTTLSADSYLTLLGGA